MGDAFLVRRRHRVGEWDGDLEELVQNETARGDELRQGLSLNELHRNEVIAFGFLDREDLDDVGVVESREGFGFPLEPSAAFFVFG